MWAPEGPTGGGPGTVPGTVLGGRFQLEAPLGTGGQGRVIAAVELGGGRRAAVKVAWRGGPEEAWAVRALEREARALATVRHPGVPELLGVGAEADGTRWLAMELLPGSELSQLLADSGPFPERWTVAIGAGLLSALAAVHAAGLVHGDVTPANALVDGHPGEPDGVALVDFGLAARAGEAGLATDARLPGEATPAGEAMLAGEAMRLPGAPGYLSPERVRGAAADGRSDLYAVGVLLFELATGVVPFRAATAAGVLARHLAEAAPPVRRLRPDLSAGLEAVIARALEKDPLRRFADAEAMREALLRCRARG